MDGSISGLSILFIDLYVYPYTNTTLVDYNSFIVRLENKQCMSSNLVIFLGILHFDISLEPFCQFLPKKPAGILIVIVLNLYYI